MCFAIWQTQQHWLSQGCLSATRRISVFDVAVWWGCQASRFVAKHHGKMFGLEWCNNCNNWIPRSSIGDQYWSSTASWKTKMDSVSKTGAWQAMTNSRWTSNHIWKTDRTSKGTTKLGNSLWHPNYIFYSNFSQVDCLKIPFSSTSNNMITWHHPDTTSWPHCFGTTSPSIFVGF